MGAGHGYHIIVSQFFHADGTRIIDKVFRIGLIHFKFYVHRLGFQLVT
jgi:hypothetical protein|tara:strand:- start:874 stop:1017 length:144 start_codon:yes stop_codon:yes gene_type:complete